MYRANKNLPFDKAAALAISLFCYIRGTFPLQIRRRRNNNIKHGCIQVRPVGFRGKKV